MWHCKVCKAAVDDDAQGFCHHCGVQRDIEQALADQIRLIDLKAKAEQEVVCIRCRTAMTYVGVKRFHEGTRAWGFLLGDLGELLVKREQYDVYVCKRCGKVEFFLDGIGDAGRGEPA